MRTILIVDGYNAIHAIEPTRKLIEKDMKRAREELLKICRSFRRSSGYIDEVKVVFDGSGRGSDGTELFGSLGKDAIFSSVDGADGLLIEMVRDLGVDNRILLATRDNFVCNNSRALGAKLLDPAELHTTHRKRSDSFSRQKNTFLTSVQEQAITRAYRKLLERGNAKK